MRRVRKAGEAGVKGKGDAVGRAKEVWALIAGHVVVSASLTTA